ncbi:MAG TPA: hypothetical protein VHX60_01680 [Acidobacteriaceae bacterium]|jgi:hypothetical protein|nr:hypothetical protein [Acidobacteriaceae bacterium]
MKRNRHFITALCGAALLAAPAFAFPNPYAPQTASQDMKTAGHDTKDAAKDTGNGVKKGTKKAAHATKKGTKKAWHKTKSTTTGAVDGAKAGSKKPD